MADAPAVKTEPRVLSVARLKENQIVGIADMRKMVGELTPILAKTVPAFLRNAVDRVGSNLMVEMGRNEHVAKATALSLLGGLVQAAQLGLELGGVLGQAYLVPYWNKSLGAYEAQFQCGYRGLIALAARAGMTKVFDAHPVFEKDEFQLSKGTSPGVLHTPCMRGLPGELIGVYAYSRSIHDEVQVEWMTREELEAHRDKYSKAKKDSSPWVTAFNEMARKTPLRRLGKRLPMSAEMQQAATLDEYADEDIRQNLGALVRGAVDPEELPPSSKAKEVLDAISPSAGSGPEPIDPDAIPR